MGCSLSPQMHEFASGGDDVGGTEEVGEPVGGVVVGDTEEEEEVGEPVGGEESVGDAVVGDGVGVVALTAKTAMPTI